VNQVGLQGWTQCDIIATNAARHLSINADKES